MFSLSQDNSMKNVVYVSGYTNDKGRGIYKYEFNDEDGQLYGGKLVLECASPSWLAKAPGSQYIYALNEVPEGTVTAIKIEDDDNGLSIVNQCSSGGAHPCHALLIVEQQQDNCRLLVANYSNGAVAALNIDPKSGAVSEGQVFINPSAATLGVPHRQQMPHAHSIDKVQGWAYSMDLGTDEARVFDLRVPDLQPSKVAFKFPVGTGPRHLATSSKGDKVYVLGELSNTIHVLSVNKETGELAEIQQIRALPDDFTGDNLGSEIALSLDGKFLYAAMRGHNSIAIFRVLDDDGRLELIGHESTQGDHPRHFTFDPSGQYLLVGNQVCLRHNVAPFFELMLLIFQF